jgi:predicted  nucleic acid-binding Zn-ribbon protein
MDHPCYKCGHLVEDGKPFCAQCGAPQIRVEMPELVSSAAVAGAAGVPNFSESSETPGSLRLPFTSAIEWNRALRSCAIAALIAAIVMALGLMVPLLAVLGASLLAVNLYHRSNPAWIVNARSGAKLGAACGVVFFAIATILESIAVALLHTEDQVREKLMEALQQAAARSNDPQVQAAFEQFKTPQGIALMLVLGAVVLFLISTAAGSLAGALTGAVLGRKRR